MLTFATDKDKRNDNFVSSLMTMAVIFATLLFCISIIFHFNNAIDKIWILKQ